jgi:hypothetical protein
LYAFEELDLYECCPTDVEDILQSLVRDNSDALCPSDVVVLVCTVLLVLPLDELTIALPVAHDVSSLASTCSTRTVICLDELVPVLPSFQDLEAFEVIGESLPIVQSISPTFCAHWVDFGMILPTPAWKKIYSRFPATSVYTAFPGFQSDHMNYAIDTLIAKVVSIY